MGIYGDGMDGGGKAQGDEQIVGEGAKNATDKDISSLLARRTHAQRNHLSSGSQRDDGCSDSSLAQPDALGEPQRALHYGRPPHSHGYQTSQRQQQWLPVEAGTTTPLLLIIIVVIVVFGLRQALHGLLIGPKQEDGV